MSDFGSTRLWNDTNLWSSPDIIEEVGVRNFGSDNGMESCCCGGSEGTGNLEIVVSKISETSC